MILSEISVIAGVESESWWSDDAIKRVITTCPDVQTTDDEKRYLFCTWNTKVLPMFYDAFLLSSPQIASTKYEAMFQCAESIYWSNFEAILV